MSLVVRLALRDLRGSWRGLRVAIACIALGVAAIASVGQLRAALLRGLAQHGQEMLGGDLRIETGYRPLPPGLGAFLRARGARVARVTTLSTLLRAPGGEQALVALKAVGPAWPLLGAARFGPPGAPDRLGPDQVAVDPVLLARLGVAPGAWLRLGSLRAQVRPLAAEPDRGRELALIGPRALVNQSLLARSALVAPGALISHSLVATLPSPRTLPGLIVALRARYAGAGLTLRTGTDADPGLRRFIDRLGAFLALAGLAALLVGAIGAASGVRAWLTGRLPRLAVLRCLGASGRQVLQVALIEVALLEALGVLIGVALGVALPLAGLALFHDALPVPTAPGIALAPLALAAFLGFTIAFGAVLPMLDAARAVPAGLLFRAGLAQAGARPRNRSWALAAALIGAGLAAAIGTAAQPGLAVIFCLASAATLGVFLLAGVALRAAARRAHGRLRAATPRLALAALYRPGNTTPLLMASLGLGLTVLVTIGLVDANLAGQIGGALPRLAPSFFFIDIQPGEVAPFTALARTEPGARDLRLLPYIPSRVIAVNGVPAERLHPTPDTAWALRGARGLALTIAASPPKDTHIVAGQWWPNPYDGPPQLSLDAHLAAGWGVKLGDTLTVDVLGRPIPLRVTSLRHIAWQTLAMNFAMVASPGLLSGAPHTMLATLRVPPPRQGGFLRRVADALPNVTGIAVADVLRGIALLLDQLAAAVSAAGLLTLLAGALVLAGSVAAGQQARLRDAVILKAAGARLGQLRGAAILEFGLLGAAAGLVATGLGLAASYAVLRFVMHAPWHWHVGMLLAALAAGMAIMLILGLAGTEAALRAPASRYLRTP